MRDDRLPLLPGRTGRCPAPVSPTRWVTPTRTDRRQHGRPSERATTRVPIGAGARPPCPRYRGRAGAPAHTVSLVGIERDLDLNQVADLFRAADTGGREAPPFVGRGAIREYWADVPRSQENITFRGRVLAVIDGGTAIATWQAAFTRIQGGTRVELDGAFVLTFNAGGLCAELREWWHRRERS